MPLSPSERVITPECEDSEVHFCSDDKTMTKAVFICCYSPLVSVDRCQIATFSPPPVPLVWV